jgi:hypothetical protein
MNRYQAFALHLSCSALVGIVVFCLLRFVWYPGPLFSVVSGFALFKLIVMVDVILGPLLTLIVFRSGKKNLKFDLACIVLAQILFFSYGMWSVYCARPVYVVFVDNKFKLVCANEIEPKDIAAVSNAEFNAQPFWGPKSVGAVLPDDPKVREDILFAELFGMGIQNKPQYFVEYAKIKQRVLSVAKSPADLKSITSDERVKLAVWEKQYGKPVLFVPLKDRRWEMYVAIDSVTGDFLQIL